MNNPPDLKQLAAQAVQDAFAVGMFQHADEVGPFAEYLAARRPHHVIEIGGLHGGTAVLWSALCTGKVISIDLPNGRFGGADHHYNWKGCEERNARLSERLPRFVGILGNSHDENMPERVGAELLQDPGRVDMLFIDGDHTFAGVAEDQKMYTHLVSPGGIIVFHDINDTQFHRDAGCRVDQLWSLIQGNKREFNIHAQWGGIGVVEL